MTTSDKIQCEKCGRLRNQKDFYTYKNGDKVEICKDCLTMHIDNFDPDTFTWLLEKMDVPYVPSEWNVLRDRAFAKNPEKMNGMSVFGKYLSKMKLKQWKDYSWADSEKVQQLQEEKLKTKAAEKAAADAQFEKELKAKFDAGIITEAEYKTLMSTPTQHLEYKPQTSDDLLQASGEKYGTAALHNQVQIEIPDPTADLTQEDLTYLALKWGQYYEPQEWLELEKLYTEMTESFDIQDADTVNSLIIICKLNLKANKALDMGDFDGFAKLSRELGNQRKLANFAASQRKKEEKNDFVDSVGELVAYCEKNGGQIPEMHFDEPQDIVDKIIFDLKDYTKSLIYEDTALAGQIEDYLKKKEIMDQKKKDREEAKEKGLDVPEVTDEDIHEYYKDIEKQKEEDAKRNIIEEDNDES